MTRFGLGLWMLLAWGCGKSHSNCGGADACAEGLFCVGGHCRELDASAQDVGDAIVVDAVNADHSEAASVDGGVDSAGDAEASLDVSVEPLPQLVASVCQFVHVSVQRSGVLPPHIRPHSPTPSPRSLQSSASSHTNPQSPQLSWVSISMQPSPQFFSPTGHTQVPSVQVVPAGHAVPTPSAVHPPQFASSESKSTQSPSQSSSAAPPQELAHTPSEHTSLLVQVSSQSPQCSESVCTSTHSLPHRTKPASQALPSVLPGV